MGGSLRARGRYFFVRFFLAFAIGRILDAVALKGAVDLVVDHRFDVVDHVRADFQQLVKHHESIGDFLARGLEAIWHQAVFLVFGAEELRQRCGGLRVLFCRVKDCALIAEVSGEHLDLSLLSGCEFEHVFSKRKGPGAVKRRGCCVKLFVGIRNKWLI